jgi:hypothetical protein
MTTHMLGENSTDIVDEMCQEVEKQIKTFEVRRTHIPIKCVLCTFWCHVGQARIRKSRQAN